MIRRLSCALVGLVLGACAAAGPRPGGVRVDTNVPDAILLVDEETRGPVRAYEREYVRLPPGAHRLMLEHPDYFTEYIDVTVVENMAMAVRLEMRRRPEE